MGQQKAEGKGARGERRRTREMVNGEEASKRSLKLKPVRMHHPRGSSAIGAAHTVLFSSGRQ